MNQCFPKSLRPQIIKLFKGMPNQNRPNWLQSYMYHQFTHLGLSLMRRKKLFSKFIFRVWNWGLNTVCKNSVPIKVQNISWESKGGCRLVVLPPCTRVRHIRTQRFIQGHASRIWQSQETDTSLPSPALYILVPLCIFYRNPNQPLSSRPSANNSAGRRDCTIG